MLWLSVLKRSVCSELVNLQFLLFQSIIIVVLNKIKDLLLCLFETGESYMALARCYQGVHLLESEEKWVYGMESSLL